MANTAQIVDIARVVGVTGVGSISLTGIEQGEDGRWARELRVYEEVLDTTEGAVGRLVLTVRLTSATKEGIEQTTPSLKF
jgi:hypothetical protein